MSKASAVIQIALGIMLAYLGAPNQAKILVYVCEQEASLGWLSFDVCLFSKYLLLVLGFISLLLGIVKLSLPEKKK